MADLAKPDEARRLFTRLDLDHDGLLSTAEYFPEPKL
jgi:Ca2+-binding EF-hand superfamily protein